uniref:BRCT domain-containing protein n=1 Tax=Globodera rostochiensis TaxID=31243 RepID=A0A914HEI2_GLORO
MDCSNCILLRRNIEEQKSQILRYEAKFKVLISAYKSLTDAKQSFEVALSLLSSDDGKSGGGQPNEDGGENEEGIALGTQGEGEKLSVAEQMEALKQAISTLTLVNKRKEMEFEKDRQSLVEAKDALQKRSNDLEQQLKSLKQQNKTQHLEYTTINAVDIPSGFQRKGSITPTQPSQQQKSDEHSEDEGELTPRRPSPIPTSERGDLADAEGRSATNAEECFAKALGEGPLRDGSVQNGHTGRQEQSVQSIEVEVHSPLESVQNASPQQPQPPKPTGRLYAKAAQTGKVPRTVAKKEPEIEGGELESLFPVSRTNMPEQQNTPPPREPLPLSSDSLCLEEGLANPISGIVVTFTGLSRDKRVTLSEKLRKMGAQASAEMDSQITHLIAEKCDPNSEKYKEARRRKLPVLLPAWVYAASAGDDLGTRSVITPEEIVGTFKTPLFAACEITVSGFPGAERVDIGRLVELHGGVFTGQMSRSSCTHLIAANNSGDKFRLAHEWGTVRVVTSRWLRKCIETGYRLSESNFAFLTDDKVGQRPFSPGWSCLSLPTNQKADNATRAETMALAPAAKKMKMTPTAKGKLARA